LPLTPNGQGLLVEDFPTVSSSDLAAMKQDAFDRAYQTNVEWLADGGARALQAYEDAARALRTVELELHHRFPRHGLDGHGRQGSIPVLSATLRTAWGER
jgi:hypothetical protein